MHNEWKALTFPHSQSSPPNFKTKDFNYASKIATFHNLKLSFINEINYLSISPTHKPFAHYHLRYFLLILFIEGSSRTSLNFDLDHEN
jgi:hypothetical protein